MAHTDPQAAADRHGLRIDVLKQVLAGELDTVLGACTDNTHSPHAPPGKPCRASFLLCLTCPCARATPAHLPLLVGVHDRLLDEPDHLGALGLTPDQVEDIRQGELDMGVTQCRDPYDSPYSRTGELCAVAPLRCLECRNAWVLPSNLPQLLLFADHLDQLRQRLSPEHYAALWGQSHTNLHSVLAERTDEEKSLARKHIQNGDASLHLPLSALAEFDA